MRFDYPIEYARIPERGTNSFPIYAVIEIEPRSNQRGLMDSSKLLGFLGFALIMGPFSFGMATTLAPAAKPEPVVVVAPTPSKRPDPIYVPYVMPLTVTLPKFNRSVSVKISFMMDSGSPAIDELQAQMDAFDGRVDAVLTGAINEAEDAVNDIDRLRSAIPQLIRHAINVQLGTEEDPQPVREVLLTSYAHQ